MQKLLLIFLATFFSLNQIRGESDVNAFENQESDYINVSMGVKFVNRAYFINKEISFRDVGAMFGAKLL